MSINIKKTCNKQEYLKISENIFNNSIFHKEFRLNYISDRVVQDTYFLYDNNQLIGYLRYGKSPEYFDNFGVKFLGILPEWTHKKYGFLLLNRLKLDFKGTINNMYLSIPSNCEFLHKYYINYGFQDYAVVYAAKFKENLFGWYPNSAINVLNNQHVLIEKTPKLIMRLNLQDTP